MLIAEVIVDVSSSEVDRVFDYYAGRDVLPGCRVLVPFGSKYIEGYVIRLKEKSDFALEKLKSILRPIDRYPVINAEMLELMDAMVAKYHLRKIDALRLFIPAEMRGGRVRELIRLFASMPEHIGDAILTYIKPSAKKQIELAEYLLAEGKAPVAAITKLFSPAALDALEKKGLVVITEEEIARKPYKDILYEAETVRLTAEQQNAVDAILNSGGGVHLLHGVTGSGKTEVYIRCISTLLDAGKTAIFMVPEISLTPQMLRYFRMRFGERVAILHSALSSGERFDEWRRLLLGKAQIAIGARSAVFAPLKNLGVIVIDEEHDQSYRSDNNPRYDTAEVARLRMEYNNCLMVLGSATPSVETYYLSETGAYKRHELSGRINRKPLPKIDIVDMFGQMRLGSNGIFSDPLVSALNKCLASGGQSMVFLNRRGYASFMRCRSCDYVYTCEDCDMALVYHSETNVMKCHLCNRNYAVDAVCKNCGSSYIRLGAAGTQRVADELKKLVPGARILRMDNDTTRGKEGHHKILSAFARREADILVGTQMIVKGHNFPGVTVVGIIDADMSLHFSEYRASERTFQLVTQVAGRAGRDEAEGTVYLQTFSPRHYVYKYAAAYDYKGFYDREINVREVTKYPPFADVLRVMMSGEDEQLALGALKKIYDEINAVKAKDPDAFVYLKAMKSVVKKIKSVFRFQILLRVRGERANLIIESIYSIIDKYYDRRLTCFLEVNPQSLC